MSKNVQQAEFSRLFSLEDLGEDDLAIALQSTAEERAALARRFDVAAIDSFSATAKLARREGGVVALTVTIRARLTQTCVISLEPFESVIEETAERLFAPVGAISGALPMQPADEIAIAAEEADPPEPLAGSEIDLGEVAAEQLGLAIDPYPKRPGVVFGRAEFRGPSGQEPGESPFAVLATVRTKQ